MNKENLSPLEKIVFISIPEETAQKIKDFTIDTSILLPVEIPEGEDNWRIQDLSWEMIIAAMMKIFAWQPDHPDTDYYRSFISAIQPDLEYKMSQTGILKAKNKDFAIAEEIFRALSNFNPHNVNNSINLALVFEEQSELYEKLGNSELSEKYITEAFRVYIETSKLHAASPDVYFNLGNFYIKNGNLEKARRSFEEFLILEPEGKRKEFVEQILNKIPVNPSDDLLFLEAYDLIRMEKEDEGIEKIKLYLKKNPKVWNAWFLLGWAYRRKELYNLGKEALLKSIELENKNLDSYNELAICLMELEEFTECRNLLERALKLDGENTKIISNLGVLAIKQNNYNEAEGFFKTVLEYSPDDYIAQEYIKFIKQKK